MVTRARALAVNSVKAFFLGIAFGSVVLCRDIARADLPAMRGNEEFLSAAPASESSLKVYPTLKIAAEHGSKAKAGETLGIDGIVEDSLGIQSVDYAIPGVFMWRPVKGNPNNSQLLSFHLAVELPKRLKGKFQVYVRATNSTGAFNWTVANYVAVK